MVGFTAQPDGTGGRDADRRRADFLGANDPYNSLKAALRGEIDEEAWATLYREVSRPFRWLEMGGIAVKVINHFGDDGVLPLQSRLEAFADETELDDVYETKRQLFYVACTRARDCLLISAVPPASEFIQDIQGAGS
jgi:hypothetical protein